MNKKEKDEKQGKENWVMGLRAFYFMQHVLKDRENKLEKIYHFPASKPTPVLEIKKTIKRFHKK